MKIICVGRNYAAHAKELNNKVPVKPVIFLKPETALLKSGQRFYYPEFSANIHYECELVFRIGKNGRHIAEEFAWRYVDGMALGIDFTARDIQDECKQKGLPWERAKAFDHSAVCCDFFPVPDNWETVPFTLKKNNQLVQEATGSLMLFSVPRIISEVSSFITLKKGDLIYTGTPAGVGAVEKGDLLEGFWKDEKVLETRIC